MVRTFPRTTRVHGAVLALSACLLAGTAVAPLASADDLKAKQHRVERKVNAVHDDLDESSAQLRRAAAALSSAQTRLAAAQDHLAKTRGELAAAEVLDQQMQAKLAAAIERMRSARAELRAGRRKVAEQQHTLGQIVVQNYQTGDPSLMGLSMVLTSQDPTELTGQLNSVRNVIDKESVVLDRLEASRALLVVQQQEVAIAKAEVAAKRDAAAANLKRKQGLEAQAEAAETSVQNLVQLRSQAQQEAAKAKAADLAQLRNLERERDRIAAVLKRRAEEARRRALAAAARAGAAGIPGAGGRVASNGFLDYPVQGPVTSPFGWRIHPIYGYRSLHDGIDFGAACGTPIRAAASGRVLEEYFQTAWGNRIIIDHGFHRGVGLASISNHLSRYAVPAGAYVKRGQVIGYVGTTGWSTGCHLHYTVLQNGVAVDPQRWF